MKKTVLALSLLAATPLAAQTTSATAPAIAEGSPLAAEIAAKLFPDGTYRQMLGPSMSQMMGSMTDSFSGMELDSIYKAAGIGESDMPKPDKATIGEVMAIIDPAYKDRMRRGMDAMFTAMIPIFEKFEPDLRAGLALSLDRRFTPGQLGDLKAFFATPTGGNFASQQMLLFMDPAVMGKMQAAMPKIMAEMPKLISAMTEATKELPKARTYKDLTGAERDKLAKLLGLDPKKLKR